MVVLVALLIFLAITTAVWFVGLALYKVYVGEPDLRQQPGFWPITLTGLGFGTILGLVPYPWGFLLTSLYWFVLAFAFPKMPWWRALAFGLILTALSFLSRLAVGGVLRM